MFYKEPTLQRQNYSEKCCICETLMIIYTKKWSEMVLLYCRGWEPRSEKKCWWVLAGFLSGGNLKFIVCIVYPKTGLNAESICKKCWHSEGHCLCFWRISFSYYFELKFLNTVHLYLRIKEEFEKLIVLFDFRFL